MIDVSSFTGRDPVEDFDIIRRELALFRDNDAITLNGTPLADKHQLVAANKIDALDEPERLDRLREHTARLGLVCYPVSAVTGKGVAALLEAIWATFQTIRADETQDNTDGVA
jgi:GTP-binding protein